MAQTKRKLGLEKQKVAMQEITKLLKAEFIKVIYFTTWLANVFMVPKSLGKWWMCVDFIDLKQGAPK